jgi:hypothetical protein
MTSRPFHFGSSTSSRDCGASSAETRFVLYPMTRARSAKPCQYPFGSAKAPGQLASVRHAVSSPSRASRTVWNTSPDQNTSAAGAEASARIRCTSPTVLLASVS